MRIADLAAELIRRSPRLLITIYLVFSLPLNLYATRWPDEKPSSRWIADMAFDLAT